MHPNLAAAAVIFGRDARAAEQTVRLEVPLETRSPALVGPTFRPDGMDDRLQEQPGLLGQLLGGGGGMLDNPMAKAALAGIAAIAVKRMMGKDKSDSGCG